MEFPIRINKYLAVKGICSRREADKLIEKGLVKINGKTAVIGDKVGQKDQVQVKPSVSKNLVSGRVYLAYNKPIGIVTVAPQKGEKAIADVLKYKTRVYPVGRLDKESHGLIILTNDGRLSDKILNPKYFHEKEYLVKVNKRITPGFINKMKGGVEMEDGYLTKKCKAERANDSSFSIILTEGKKHQIRRMCAVLGYEVFDLKRVRIMNIFLGDLKQGEFKEISGKELQEFLSGLGLKK